MLVLLAQFLGVAALCGAVVFVGPLAQRWTVRRLRPVSSATRREPPSSPITRPSLPRHLRRSRETRPLRRCPRPSDGAVAQTRCPIPSIETDCADRSEHDDAAQHLTPVHLLECGLDVGQQKRA